MQFKQKFVEYLSQGIPIRISDDEIETFYFELEKFVNESDNSFISIYDDTNDYVTICDANTDYLRVRYQDDKIIFLTTQDTVDQTSISTKTVNGVAESLVGVMFFLEMNAPNGDISVIPEVYKDVWNN